MIKLFSSKDDSNLGIREKLIRRISFWGLVLTFIPIIEELIMDSSSKTLIPLVILIGLLIIAQILTYVFNKHNAAAVVIGIAIGFFVFPSVFFLSGGIYSGATVYFVLGIFYWLGMFKGAQRIVYTILSVIIYCACYYVGYKYPYTITKMESKFDVYIDSLIAILLVGVLLGIVTTFQIRAYEKERKTALEQRDEIEKFSNNKNDLFASMSHEIRTPINAIIGLDEMILREEELSEEVANDALTIQSASKMLLSLVNDIMDFSQIEGHKMEITPIEYGTETLFADLIEMIKLRVDDKDLDFIVSIDRDMPSILYGDDKRIKQVVLNLLTNAVKYTKQGSVTLEAHAEKIDEFRCNLYVSVIDTGVGIKSENLETLFDLFSRVKNTDNRTIEGTGLGLSISKKLMDLMGGTITVHSIYTKGSEFTICLEQRIVDSTPIGNTESIREKSVERPKYQQLFEAPDARILVVDDNEMNRSVVQKLLKSTKVIVDVAKSGAECLQLTQKKYYNIILMDYLMPEQNGAATLVQLKKQEGGMCKDTPVVLLTGDLSLQRNNDYGEMGFDAFLEKPIRGEILERTILSFLPDELIEYRQPVNTLENSSPMLNAGIFDRKRKKVCITTECTCDIPDDLLKEYDIGMIYHYVLRGNCRFNDTREIDFSNIPNTQIALNTLKAEAAPVSDYETFFAEYVATAEEVIHISLGKKVGDSYANALEASKGFGAVKVIDSGTLSGGMALIVLDAAKMAAAGATAEEILEEIERIKRNISSRFLLPNAESFYTHGYTSKYVQSVFDFLGLHPILKVKNSGFALARIKVGNYKNSRERFLNKYLMEKRRNNRKVIYITHAGISADEVEALRQRILAANIYDEVYIQKTSVTIACFAGRGSIGVTVYLEK